MSSGSVTYLIADSLGSVRGTVSSAGSLAASTSYDAWGNPATPGGLLSSTPFGFAGGYTDPTGLLYLINRYYDPATGQFQSVDPEVSQTAQAYAYANGNPVSQVDPSGLSVCTVRVDYPHISSTYKRQGIQMMSVDALVTCTRGVSHIYLATTLWKQGCAGWCAYRLDGNLTAGRDTTGLEIKHTQTECTNNKRTQWQGTADSGWVYRWGAGFSSGSSPWVPWACGT